MASGDERVGRMFGHYRITAVLGRGGMGDVYRAEDTRKGRTVALKILSDRFWRDERFRTRFERESRAAAVLQEPHVIPIHDWGEIDGHPYIDMRLVDGRTLHDLLRTGPLAPARAVQIIEGVAAALDAAHAAGLIHRDVKPQNILVTPSDFPYLVDFGIAQAAGETGLTMTGMQIGTWNYMAPERFRDEPTTPAVDVYALACVLYECLTGSIPFPANSLERTMSAHLMAEPPRPSVVNPRVPAAFDEVIARGMAKNPRHRYPSCGALAQAARQALSAHAVTAAAPRVPRNSPPAAADHSRPAAPQGAPAWLVPTIVGVTAALLLAGVGVVIGVVASRDPSPASTASTPSTSFRTAQQPVSSNPRSTSPRTVTPSEVPLGVGAPPPPPIPGPDANGAVCRDDFSLINRSGPGTRARRGSAETSCHFTRNVLQAYWNQHGDASREPRKITAPGAVDCRSVPTTEHGCDGSNFIMMCAGHPGEAFIRCTGGRRAVVYLY